MFLLIKGDLPLTSLLLSGKSPVGKSIPVWFVEDIVSNLKVSVEDVFDMVKENLFPRSLMGAIMQDGGTRERRDGMVLQWMTTNNGSIFKIMIM